MSDVFSDLIDIPRDYLSPTQVTMYLRCPAQYYHRYVLDLKIPPDGALVQGIAVHDAAETDLKAYMESKEHLTVDDVMDIVATTFDAVSEDAEFKEDENPGDLKDQAVSLGKLWRKKVAETINPVAVEETWEIEVNGITYTGRYDVVESVLSDASDQAQEIIRDLKTAARKPKEDALVQSVQAQSYALARQAETGDIPSVRFDYLVKNKNPVVNVRTAQYDDAALDVMAETVEQVAHAIKAGVFPRNRDGWHCSPNYCGYYDRCLSRRLTNG